jgi:type VI secretion system lysozyme-like protein
MALLGKLANNQDDYDELNSIIKNLNNLLTTKRGYGFFLQDFGLSDYHHLSACTEITAQIIEEIKQIITQFEPRIEVIEVVHIQNDAFERLSFAINCQVRSTNLPLNLLVDPKRGCVKVNP